MQRAQECVQLCVQSTAANVDRSLQDLAQALLNETLQKVLLAVGRGTTPRDG